MANWQDIKLGLEMASGGKNTILFDNANMPSVMVKIPKMKYRDLFSAAELVTFGVTDDYLPAFKLADGTVKDYFMASKYENIVENGKAYSLPHRTPTTGMDFDTALSYCESKGTGWHLMTNAEWSCLQLITNALVTGRGLYHAPSKEPGLLPRGNNNYGRQKEVMAGGTYPYSYDELGIEATNDGSGPPPITNLIKTGSGPDSWSHNNTPWGVFDLNGNVSEWIAGLRYKDHELQVTRYNESAIIGASGHLVGSSDWYSISGVDGSFVACGNVNACKTIIHTGSSGYTGVWKTLPSNTPIDSNGLFYYITSHSSLGSGGTAIANPAIFILSTLGLFGKHLAAGGGDLCTGILDFEAHLSLEGNPYFSLYNDKIYLNSSSITETIALRGGDYEELLAAGIFALDFRNARTFTSAKTGLRCCYLP
jgi:hypothetical protein